MKLTDDDFVLFPDDGMRHELIPRGGAEPLQSVVLGGLDIPMERIFRNTPVL